MLRRFVLADSLDDLSNADIRWTVLIPNNDRLTPYTWNGTSWTAGDDVAKTVGIPTFIEGSNITISNNPSTNEITITATGGAGSSWGGITGTLANQADLKSALDGKAPTHTHPYASDTHDHNAIYAPISHTHSISDTTGLQTALDGKASSSHNHDASYSAIGHTHTGVYESANANIQAHIASSHAPANAQKNSDILKSEIEAVLTGVIASHSHTGGSDPWTYVKLASDFVTSSATAVNVTNFNFTPAINSTYVVEGMFFTRTATATVGVRPGCSWPASLTDGVARFMQTSSAAANVIANGNMNASVLTPVGGNPNNTQSYPATLWASFITGAGTSGNFQIQLASETAGTNVTLKANSWIRYRVI